MSIETQGAATVRYTMPHKSYDEFVSEPDPEHRPGRPSRKRLRPPAPLQKAEREEPRPVPPKASAVDRGVRTAKVGRNEPCPCGSGRKYKYCHLEADEATHGT
jgi:preprotein translocase subunit SecA